MAYVKTIYSGGVGAIAAMGATGTAFVSSSTPKTPRFVLKNGVCWDTVLRKKAMALSCRAATVAPRISVTTTARPTTMPSVFLPVAARMLAAAAPKAAVVVSAPVRGDGGSAPIGLPPPGSAPLPGGGSSGGGGGSSGGGGGGGAPSDGGGEATDELELPEGGEVTPEEPAAAAAPAGLSSKTKFGLAVAGGFLLWKMFT